MEIVRDRPLWATRAGAHHHHLPMAQAVVPFLGMFLTDLVMLDTVMNDYVDVSDPGAWW